MSLVKSFQSSGGFDHEGKEVESVAEDAVFEMSCGAEGFLMLRQDLDKEAALKCVENLHWLVRQSFSAELHPPPSVRETNYPASLIRAMIKRHWIKQPQNEDELKASLGRFFEVKDFDFNNPVNCGIKGMIDCDMDEAGFGKDA